MVKRWQDIDGMHLDLQGMSPPDPMVTILREIEAGATGPLIVHMDRDPVHLYQELEERGWTCRPLRQKERLESAATMRQAPVILELNPDDAP